MLDKIQIVKPAEIEKRSMEIITSELNGRTWPEPEFSIVKRCIHTSADFDYADNLCFSENAANIGVEAVSYTHLDVYKRQIRIRECRIR